MGRRRETPRPEVGKKYQNSGEFPLRKAETGRSKRREVRFFETASAFGAFRRNKYGAEEDFDFEAEIDEEGVDSSSGDTSEEDI